MIDKNTSKPVIEIPDKPVDKFIVRWWVLEMNDTMINIDEYNAIYFVSSPWEENSLIDSIEVPFLDKWVVKCNGVDVGRVGHWDGILEVNRYSNRFSTKQEAIEESIRLLNESIEKCKKKLCDLRSLYKNQIRKLSQPYISRV